jgi:hypothetical protein
MKRKYKDPNTFRSRVWRRRDFKNALKQVLMSRSDIENCTFEPEAGTMSKYMDFAMRHFPDLRREELTNEPDPESYVKKLGKDFITSHPEVYKAGVLKKAKVVYKKGLLEQALNIMYEGFNIDSIRKRYDPKYMKRFIAEQIIKKRQEREAREREENSLNRQGSVLTRALTL